MIMRGIAKNISDMGHESIVLQPTLQIFQKKRSMKVSRLSEYHHRWVNISHYTDVSPGTLGG
jgi:hypothetical protein